MNEENYYTIPIWAIHYIEYGYDDNFTTEDENKLNKFLSLLPKGGYFAWPNDIDEEKGFISCNDIDNLGSDCIEVKYVIIK